MSKNDYITIRINTEVKNRLKNAAADNDVSLSALIEFLAKKFLDTYYEYIGEQNHDGKNDQ